jgi:hypothetical protein
MRLGGAFPFNSSGTFPLSLGGGGYIYPPPGNYLWTPGNQSVMQWWDPVLGGWRNYTCPPGTTQPISVDGYNYRIINMSGVVQAASITNAGSGGTNGIGPVQTGTTVSFAAAPTNGQTAKGYVVVGGSLPALSIANAGSGYLVPPLILIDPPPFGGVQATATATITSAGVLNAVTLNNVGAGYTALPNVYVVPQLLDYAGAAAFPGAAIPTSVPPGTFQLAPPQTWGQGLTPTFPATGGALVNFGAATGVSGSGTLTAIVVTDFGSLYTSTGGVPAISFAGGGLAGGVAATAVMAWAATAVSTFTGGTIGANGAPVESSLGQLLQYSNNNLLLGRPIRGSATTGGVVTIMDPGFAIQTAMASGSIALTGIVSVNPTGGGAGTMGPVTDTSVLQMMINE